MNSGSQYPQNREREHEYNEWTVLVRVGEDQWRIGQRNDSAAASSVTTAPTGKGEPDWRNAAKRYRRQARFQSFSSWRGAVLDAVRIHFEYWRQVVVDLLEPLLSSSENRTKRGEPLLSPVNHVAKAGLGRSKAWPTRKRRQSQHKFRDSLQLGAVVGLVLGCLSLVLFHQMSPVKSVPTSFPSTSNGIALGNFGSETMTLPAVHLYTVQVGPFSSQNAAANTAKQLQRQGIWTVGEQSKSGSVLLAAAALHQKSLQSFETKLKKLKYTSSINSLNLSVTNIPVAKGANAADMTKLSKWLTATVSSLNTITGVVMDGEASRDAQAAYANSKSLLPSQQVFTESGYKKQLLDFQHQWQNAYLALQQNNKDAAQQDSLMAFLDLAILQQEG